MDCVQYQRTHLIHKKDKQHIYVKCCWFSVVLMLQTNTNKTNLPLCESTSKMTNTSISTPIRGDIFNIFIYSNYKTFDY